IEGRLPVALDPRFARLDVDRGVGGQADHHHQHEHDHGGHERPALVLSEPAPHGSVGVVFWAVAYRPPGSTTLSVIVWAVPLAVEGNVYCSVIPRPMQVKPPPVCVVSSWQLGRLAVLPAPVYQ